MRTLLFGLLVAALAALCAPTASAQTDEERAVMATFNAWVTARNASDSEALPGFWAMPASYFAVGSLLFEFDVTEEQQQKIIAAQFAGGRQDTLTVHHLQARAFGDTALVTCYLSGTFVPETGTTTEGPWSMTSVWVKQDGDWRLLHFHLSQVAGGPTDVLAGIAEE